MKPALPLISQSLTSAQLRKRVLAQLAILAMNNGKAPARAVRKP
jgi:hypothetical protein